MDYKNRTKISRILIDEAVPVDSNVIILGWVRTVRSSKEVAFIEVNDGSSMKNIQGVVQNPESFPILEQILTGAAVRLEGKLVPSQGKGQKYEIAVSKVDLVGAADFQNIPKKEGKIDWDADFFAGESFLAVSGQLEAELLATALGDVYTFGPTFRAENSNTSRHAAEFWMIEPEMAFAELDDNMDVAEDFLKHLFRYALENKYEVIVIMAGNGKDNPEEIERLLRPITEEGYDFVQGSRFLSGGAYGNMPFHRLIATRHVHPLRR